MVITLGTGFGTWRSTTGRAPVPAPRDLAAAVPARARPTTSGSATPRARKKVGNRKWKKRVFAAIENLRVLTHFDRLYIGGGNSRRLDGELPDDVTVVDNAAGLIGGARLWQALGE
jgi:polyphosphate glucokinase